MAAGRRPVAPRARPAAPQVRPATEADEAAAGDPVPDGSVPGDAVPGGSVPEDSGSGTSDARTAGPGTSASPARSSSSPASLHLPARGDAAARARRARELAENPRRDVPASGRGRGLVGSLPAPRGLTHRAAAFSVLLLVVVAALAPYLHATISQRAEVAAAEADLAQTRSDVDDLEVELARWQDPLFVQREARERLALVMPGDRLYRVTGVSPSQQLAEDPRAAAADDVRTSDEDRPWFGVLWDSVGSAGREASGR